MRFDLDQGFNCPKWPLERYNSFDWKVSPSGRYLIDDFLSGSDYSNSSLIQVSNVQVWEETFKDSEGKKWCKIHGGYGTFAIVIDTEQSAPEMNEFLDALACYPSIDDDRLSELEMEAQNEAWDNWGYKEFVKALEKRFEHDLDFPNEKRIFTVFNETADHIGEYWINENADSMYINIDRIVKAVDKESWNQIVAESVEE